MSKLTAWFLSLGFANPVRPTHHEYYYMGRGKGGKTSPKRSGVPAMRRS